MIDEVLAVYDVMEKKGFEVDVFIFNIIVSCLN